MYKNEHLYTIELEELSLENLKQAFCNGADIVYFTKEHMFVGGATKGDIKRYFSSEEMGASLDTLINTQMHSIIFSDEKQAFDEAEKLFAEYRRIENIPVIDRSGELLFQIDRNNQQESNMEYILDSTRNGSIEAFLESDDIERIVLTGAEHDILLIAKETLDQHCGSTVFIEIVDDIQKCCYADKKVKVICLNENGEFFINQNTEFQTAAISAKELASFVDFSCVKKLDENTIEIWKNVFEYNAVVFCSSNRYVSRLEQMIKKCGIQVHNWKSFSALNRNIPSDFLSSLDVLLFSKEGAYCEKIQVTKMIKNIELLWIYKQISGFDMTVDKYMAGCMQFLTYLQQEGFGGVQYELNSVWKEKLSRKIKQESDLEVISAAENRLLTQNYIVNTDACIRKAIAGDYICDLQENFLKYICEYAAYMQMCKLCKNVYIFPVQEHVVLDDFNLYLERDRYNYIHTKEQFPDHFVRDICGNEGYPLDRVVRDRQDCQIVKINDGYTKFLSNYRSTYFNTDAYGRRVVNDVPRAFSGTIWLIGGCEFAGYAVEDMHTPASFLQKKINELGYPYRVVNLSHDSATILTLYNKVLDSKIDANDIVVVSGHMFILKEKMVNIDYKEISSKFEEKTWYWDSVAHPGMEGYEIYAEKIFNVIKEDLIMSTGESNNFSVEKTLESKIYNYIEELKDRLNADDHYQAIYQGAGIDLYKQENCKVGAVVMNCNPFTYGHQYLIETAARLVDLLYVFVVEENKSIFPFEKRFCMVREGAKQYENVVAVPSGEFMISSVTFPGYFLKDSPTKECYDTFLDLKIFAHYIAPAFGISMRFVGEEPTDKVTAQYNLDMKEILGDNGIHVIEIPRKRCGEDVISASRVRKLLDAGDYAALEKYIPETTMRHICPLNNH